MARSAVPFGCEAVLSTLTKISEPRCDVLRESLCIRHEMRLFHTKVPDPGMQMLCCCCCALSLRSKANCNRKAHGMNQYDECKLAKEALVKLKLSRVQVATLSGWKWSL